MFPIRRKNTEVIARRVEPAPQAPPTVVIDSARPASPMPSGAAAVTPPGPGAGPAGATQIFVIAPGAAPQQAAPPPPPATTEVHHHHTTVQYTPRRRTAAYNTSFFGSAGVVLGLLACVAVYESYTAFARPLALAGLIAGGLGFVGAVFFRRTATGLPMLALVLSAAGYVGWLYNNGQLQTQVDELRTQFPQLPKVDLGQPTATAAPHHGTTRP